MKKHLFTRTSPPMHWVGNGFPVRSIFSYDDLGAEMDPFLLLDYAAPYEFPSGKKQRGVGAHPHKGFETVTLAFQGEIAHTDSHGGGGIIGAGDVQWMTAASGLLHKEFHSEAFTKTGGIFQMAQLWVNLPAVHKSAAPDYQSIKSQDIPVVKLPDSAGSVRIIAGEFDGTRGPARTFTPINLWDVHLEGGSSLTLPAMDGHTTALLVMSGQINVGESVAAVGTLVGFKREGSEIEIQPEGSTHLLYLSGAPIGEPIVGHGPFVMNTKKEIVEAFEEFEQGKMGYLE